MNLLNQCSNLIKRAWQNPAIKATIVAAGGGALGAVMPMAMAGTFILNTATVHMAMTGAVASVVGLFIHKPQPFSPPSPQPSPSRGEGVSFDGTRGELPK